jgi:hypothetical protein
MVEQLFEFNSDLLDELRNESSLTGVPMDDLAFERLASTLESEAEIDASCPPSAPMEQFSMIA